MRFVLIYVLGIDAGGTKTVCQLANDSGEVLAEARRGGANLQASGELEVEKVLHEVMHEAIGDREISPSAICLGIAGVDRPEDARTVSGIMRRIGSKARILVVNDALVALEAGAPNEPGVVVIAGTGSIAYGRNSRNEAARSGGWGYVLGDEGSGYWIGRAALRAVLREADRRGPKTQLTGLLLKYFRIDRAQELIHEVYHGTLRPSAIAALAQYVHTAFKAGDSVAIGILRGSADELESSALSVARRLDLVGRLISIRAGRRDVQGGSLVVRRARTPTAAGVTGKPHHPPRRRTRDRRGAPRAPARLAAKATFRSTKSIDSERDRAGRCAAARHDVR